MTRLARGYGVPAISLIKICEALKVPYPPRGYWAKKRVGKKVIQFRLPEPDESTPNCTIITPVFARATVPELQPESSSQLDGAWTVVDSAVRPSFLIRPHPIVAGWLQEREREQARLGRERGPSMSLAPAGWTEPEQRRLRILNALFKTAQKNGVQVEQADLFKVCFQASGQQIELRLLENSREVRVPKTPEEIERLLPGEKDWRRQNQPTGFLTLAIKTNVATLPARSWTDTVEQPLEGRVQDVVAALRLAGLLLVERRREQEQVEGRRLQEERLRRDWEELRRLDDNRWRRFTELASQWRQRAEVRKFLEALEQHSSEGTLANGEPLGVWLKWAHARVSAFDPPESWPISVFEEVQKAG